MKRLECAAEHRDSLASIQRRFVGDVALPESMRIAPQERYLFIRILGEEPLLKESSQRLVLFPIRYNEVCKKFPSSVPLTPLADLASV
jgi:hypothetical protein